MVEMENNLDEKDIEVLPEQLTEELLELEEEHRAEEEAGVKETAGGEKNARPNPRPHLAPKEICSGGLSRSFCKLQQVPNRV